MALDGGRRDIDFSLFFFSADTSAGNEEQYRLVLEGTQLADRNGFKAVWTPERHFQSFGGIYPNPSVLSAALAVLTKHVQIRAGSLVLPLHNPIRVAEDWAQIDNLSNGRAAISFATGWHEHDYVIAPQVYESRRNVMFRDIITVRRLWAGEELEFPGVGGKTTKVKTLPRPIQPQLPFWVTVSSERTWVQAGEIGGNVLTALVNGSMTTLSQQIAAYRRARLENGHDPRTGIVSLMLHTYIGTDIDEVRAKTREPMKLYLKAFIDQFRPLRRDVLAPASSYEMQSLLDFAFERYFENSSLLGTPGKCLEMMDKLVAAGVNDMACLVDFGLDFKTTMEGIERLAELRTSFGREIASSNDRRGQING
jgi:natural product biosynthesis luciferase-like monooxygenase protein